MYQILPATNGRKRSDKTANWVFAALGLAALCGLVFAGVAGARSAHTASLSASAPVPAPTDYDKQYCQIMVDKVNKLLDGDIRDGWPVADVRTALRIQEGESQVREIKEPAQLLAYDLELFYDLDKGQSIKKPFAHDVQIPSRLQNYKKACQIQYP